MTHFWGLSEGHHAHPKALVTAAGFADALPSLDSVFTGPSAVTQRAYRSAADVSASPCCQGVHFRLGDARVRFHGACAVFWPRKVSPW